MGQSGYPARKGRTYTTIEKEAMSLRQLLRLDIDEMVPGVSLFQGISSYGGTVGASTVPLDYAVSDLPPGVLACAEYEPIRSRFVLTLSEESYAELERGGVRARFSLLHEVGHAWMHPDELIALKRMPHGRVALMRQTAAHTPTFKNTEWQANAFAGAVLIPAAGLEALERWQGRLTVEKVRRRFGTSAQTAEIRLNLLASRRAELLGAKT